MRKVVIIIVITFMLAGCTFSTPEVLPTVTQTPKFIRLASPTTGSNTPKPRPTQTPTVTITMPISGTQNIPTLTETPTVTPTPVPNSVAVLPDPSGYSWQVVVSGLSQPEGMMNAGDGSGRLFILEQSGRILIFKDGSLLPAPFLDLTSKVDCCGERGLLGLAFHPKYAENGYFFVDYTEKENNKLYVVVARYTISPDNPDQADPGTELRLLRIEKPGSPPYLNHNGGQLQFGPDGYLYIGVGDGGSEGDPLGNGQSVQTLLGKILRIDVNQSEPYTIPADNPFASGGGLAEIWAYGLRNPWRFSFDRLTGDLYIGDVGQDLWEEIDFLPVASPGGINFGWSYYEATHPYRGSPPATEKFMMPVAEYSHDEGNAVIGGYVYRGQKLPAWWGVYIYGDYGSGRVWGLLHLADGSWKNSLMFETRRNISSFGMDEEGEIYLVDDGGNILVMQ
jgi:glucose/arabinose dehydrogenase